MSEIISNAYLQQRLGPDAPYPLRRGEDGFCGNALIFVMHEFNNSNPRKGALKEVKNLKKFAQLLSLKPHVFVNAKKRKVLDTLDYVSNPPEERHPKISDDIWNARVLPSHDAIFVAVSSHGDSKSFLTADESHLRDADIECYLNEESCPLLSGKPKFLFFNKCRTNNGDVYETYIPPSAGSQGMKVDSNECELGPGLRSDGTDDVDEVRTRVSSAHFIRIYTCSDGTVSFRSQDSGSLVISALPEAYESYGRGQDIDMFFRRFRGQSLEEINRKVRMSPGLENATQCINTENNTLTRPLVFPYASTEKESCEEMEVEQNSERSAEEKDEDYVLSFAADDSQRTTLSQEKKSKTPKSGFLHRKCKYKYSKKAQHTFRPGGPRNRRSFFSFFVKS